LSAHGTIVSCSLPVECDLKRRWQSLADQGNTRAKVIGQTGSILPVDTCCRAAIHRFFDLFFRRAGGVVNNRLVIVVIMVVIVIIIAFHLENFRADLGADFTADAGILVDDGGSGHGIPHFRLGFLTISIGTAGLQGRLAIEEY
jgi:hypothetical protein